MSISRSQAQKASKRIRHHRMVSSDLAIVQQWRNCCVDLTVTCFKIVLECAQMLGGAVATYRMKRVESIISKLQRPNSSFNLPSLDDIGGCRLIVETTDQVLEAKDWISSKFHEMPDCEVDITVKDYIAEPKKSGYRSCHLIVRFQNQDLADRVEIQIRTKLQHYWATGVEVFDEVYGSSLKSPRGEIADSGTANYQRLLVIVSSLFAVEENTPVVPETPHDKANLMQELRQVPNLDSIIEQLDQACRDVTEVELAETSDAEIFILIFFKELQLLLVEPYTHEKIDEALEAYARYEQRSESNGDGNHEEFLHNNVVLVRSRPDEINLAYPNYSANVPEFLAFLKKYSGLA